MAQPQSSAPGAADVSDAAAAAPEHPFTNRLINETSPYLLQHAHNPVNWFAWGSEAFAEARKRQVPIFLSIGYSTCYWCHVMERESFEDEATAKLMNELFVSIKVDREERPDVDDIYMAAVQMLTGRGGWPMSVFLTPPGAEGEDDFGLKPFWGGTFIPKVARPNMPSFSQVLNGLSNAWLEHRVEVIKQAGALTDAVRERLAHGSTSAQIGRGQIAAAVGRLMQIYDATNAGFGQAPKFPQPVYVEFLLDAITTITDGQEKTEVEAAIRHTLDRMAVGGMNDQVGGGFHRYSTDAFWLVPHFEKMLYDNAQLAALYARAAVQFDDAFYGRVARRTCDYVLREMTSDAGVFFSAQDAEVNDREGENYLWKTKQIREALSSSDAEFALNVYGLDQGTNFRDPHHPDEAPANVLHLEDRPDVIARELGMTTDAFLKRLDAINDTLYRSRARRDQPRLDDKTIAAWNGLMIAAMSRVGAEFDEPRYLDAAAKAADFIVSNMRDDEGGLLRISRNGDIKTPAFFEDYSFFIKGLIALHRARPGDGSRLKEAVVLAAVASERFGDAVYGGYYDSLDGQTDLIVRTKSAYDGAVPSGQSVMIHNLLDLAELTSEMRYRDDAIGALAGMSRVIADAPLAPVEATRGLLRIVRDDDSLLANFGVDDKESPFTFEATDLAEPPVQVFANVDEVTVTRDKPAAVELELRIAEGFHINAHEPGVENLIGLNVSIGGGSGVRAVVEYALGEPLDTQWTPEGEQPMVHAGELRLSVRLERTEEAWAGTPSLVVSYQACTDIACQAPAKTELGITITTSD